LDGKQRQFYLDAFGIQLWVPRRGEALPEEHPEPDRPPDRGVAADEPGGAEVSPSASTAGAWQRLGEQVRQCRACPLWETRTQTVFGVGDPSADWLVIGEAPGAEEDRQGEPFVGRAGKLLNEMLFAIGLAREQVFIANVIKCRPPKNRDPRPEETAACSGFLQQQIALIEPKVMLVVGRIAAQNLLRTDRPIGKLRGRIWHWGDARIPVVVTYHPAYLLRSPLEKRKAWADLQLAKSLVV